MLKQTILLKQCRLEQDHVQPGFGYLHGKKILGNLRQLLVILTVKKYFLVFR